VQAAILFDRGADTRWDARVERNRHTPHVLPLTAQLLAVFCDALGEPRPRSQAGIGFPLAVSRVISFGRALRVFGFDALDANGHEAVPGRHARRDIHARRMRGTNE
jgi:hypothetical protein